MMMMIKYIYVYIQGIFIITGNDFFFCALVEEFMVHLSELGNKTWLN